MSVNLIKYHCPIRRIGTDSFHHFFGYYNKHVWNRTGHYLLANRAQMKEADLTAEHTLEVGYFDLKSGEYKSVGTTNAWNWQMGCQLQWLEGLEGNQLVYNSRATESDESTIYPEFYSTIFDIETMEQRTLPLPVYVVAPNSEYALCIDYSRLQYTHPTIGYNTKVAPKYLPNAPGNDGIFSMDIESGEAKLILSLQDLYNFQHVSSMDNAIHWVTHLEINSDSSRFLFIHRWTERVEDETCFLHRLFTANPDGTELHLLECSDHPIPQLSNDFHPNSVNTFDYEKSKFQISHPTWMDNGHVMAWSPHDNSIHYHLYKDRSSQVTVIGANTLLENGHMTYSPDKKWILTDTYPHDETHEQSLILYNVDKDQCYEIGSFYADPKLGKENRCDLHPRWSLDGQQVCIDSVFEVERQMYILDVAELMQAEVLDCRLRKV